MATTALVLLVVANPAVADSIRDQEWHLAALRIPEAQQVSQGEGVVVAVADTGVDDRHAELAGAVLPGKGFGEGNNSDGRVDRIGHGTAMAGLIAGRGLPNGGGVLGVAPKAMVLPLQTLSRDDGFGSPLPLASGIDWAVDRGAKVICIAAATDEDEHVQQAVERALRSDVVVVAAAGNKPDSTSIAFPARVPGVLAVGGTDSAGDHADISATGAEMVVAAPAVKIVSTSPSGRYSVGTGTSDATAIVSGVVALVRAKYPNLSGPEVVRRITATATDKGRPGRDDEFGYGIVNPVAALTADVSPASPSVDGSSSVGAPPSDAAGPGDSGGSAVKWAFGGGVLVVLLAGLGLLLRARARQ
ncbi:S8 family serine peptidase [Dactylosporangium sp. CA-233914]|uniref:S8 family serine peptidase n=1 Tax=Dactylosporangium sp. CA-233914 TaxID=3239934 RepID=UPI003D91A7CE